MKRDICGILIDDLDRKRLMGEILRRISEKRRTVVFTPNPIMAQNAKKDTYFLSILNGSDYNVPDGNGIILASRLLKTPIPERICGIELAEKLLEAAAARGLRVFLFGGEKGVAARAAVNLTKKYPRLVVCGALNGYTHSDSYVTETVNRSGADIMFVCLGSPKQEKWIHENEGKLGRVRLFMGLGGSLDVWSGKVSRAPLPVRKSGFEWAWRMAVAPKKLKDLPKLLAFGVSAVSKRLLGVVTMHK